MKEKKSHNAKPRPYTTNESRLSEIMLQEPSVAYETPLISGARLFNEIPSYQLEQFKVSGKSLKLIGEHLKIFGIRLEDVFDQSIASIYRQFKKDDIDLEYKDQILVVLKLVEKGIGAFEDAALFRSWLVAEVENLGGNRPLDLLHLEVGRREVEQILDQIEYGVFG